MRWSIFCIILAFLWLASLAEAKEGKVRLNFWPLFFYQTSKDGTVKEFELFGPILYRYQTPEEQGASLRPLVSNVIRQKTACKDTYYLSPLGHDQDCPEYSRSRLVPILGGNGDKEEAGRHHHFLLFFWGESEDGEKYRGFFPIYGRLLDWNGKDETRFFLWPVRVTSRWGETFSSTWFWPVYNHTDGPDLYERKFWPFYSHKVKRGQFDRRFVLWPFLWSERYDLSTNPTTRKMFFPFIIQEESPKHTRSQYLWPFFSFYHQKTEETVVWDLPWPFFRYGESQKSVYRERKLWPLIGYSRRKNVYSHFVFWPLYKYQREEVRHHGRVYRREIRRFYLLTKFEKVWNEKGELQYEAARVWPLGERIRRADGFEVFYFPALIPFHSEGIDRNYAPLLRLYEYFQDPRGYSRSKWFWGLYRHDHTPEEDYVDLAFVFQYHRSPKGWRFNLFHGLLGFKKEKGRFHLRLFYFLEL